VNIRLARLSRKCRFLRKSHPRRSRPLGQSPASGKQARSRPRARSSPRGRLHSTHCFPSTSARERAGTEIAVLGSIPSSTLRSYAESEPFGASQAPKASSIQASATLLQCPPVHADGAGRPWPMVLGGPNRPPAPVHYGAPEVARMTFLTGWPGRIRATPAGSAISRGF
jgi:hypothetical protein